MVDPKPLFDDEETAAAPRKVLPLDLDLETPASTVRSLDLKEAPAVEASSKPAAVAALLLPDDAPPPKASKTEKQKPASPAVAPVIGLGEHPYVGQAVKRGETLFPALMSENGFLVRNCLGQLIPLDFTRLSQFAGGTLARSAGLVMQVADLNQRFHQIDAEALVTDIVTRAKEHAGGRSHSVLGLLKQLMPFDEQAARLQLSAIGNAITRELAAIEDADGDVARTRKALGVEAAALAILNDMGDHGSMGDLINRRAAMVQTALQETEIALKQIDNLRQLARQWIMRSDEVANATLPALGFSRSLGV